MLLTCRFILRSLTNLQTDWGEMSAPNASERKACWDARDELWKCLDVHQDQTSACEKHQREFEAKCPAQWVSHGPECSSCSRNSSISFEIHKVFYMNLWQLLAIWMHLQQLSCIIEISRSFVTGLFNIILYWKWNQKIPVHLHATK